MATQMQKSRLNWLDWVALVLVIVGAINWGLVGFFAFDLVGAIFGGTFAIASRVIFAIVGLAGLYTIYTLVKINSMPAAREEQPTMRRAA